MFKLSMILMLMVFAVPAKINAVIWEDTRSWTIADEEKFSAWMQSPAVNETMFTDCSA